MRHFLSRVAISISLMAAGAALADDHVSAAGKFSAWLPDRWVVSESNGRIEAHNPPDTVQVVIGALKDADADLADDEVIDFIDEEIDDMKVTRDETVNMQGRESRLIEGNGRDEGDAVNFRAIAFDPGGAVLVALVYGDARALSREDISKAVDRILRSVRPM